MNGDEKIGDVWRDRKERTDTVETLTFETSDTMTWVGSGEKIEYVVPPLTDLVAETMQEALEPLGLAFMMVYEAQEDGTRIPRKPPYGFLAKLPDEPSTTDERGENETRKRHEDHKERDGQEGRETEQQGSYGRTGRR